MSEERGPMSFLKLLFATPILFAIAVIFVIIGAGTAKALDIDSCLSVPQYNTTLVTVFNPIDNSTSNQTFYSVSGSIQICPAHSKIDIENVSWGYNASGMNGTCDYVFSVQNSSDLFPKRIYSINLSGNSNYYADDNFVTINATTVPFYCPVCPVQQTCHYNYTFPGITNESQSMWQQDSVCDVNVTVPGRPYCLSDDTSFLMNHTCLESSTLGNLLQLSNQTASLQSQLEIYKATYSSPTEVCTVPPKVLADGWNNLNKWQRDHLSLFAYMGADGVLVRVTDFSSKSLAPTATQEEMNLNIQQAQLALDAYRIQKFADYFRENITGPDGKSYPQVSGYRALIQPACVNQSSSLMEFGKEEHGNGFWNGMLIAGGVVALLIFAFLGWLDLNTSGIGKGGS